MKSLPKNWFILVITSLGLLFLAGANVMSLKGCDEAFYAQMAKEILETGDWLSLHYDGQLNFEKPPLLIWMVALSFKSLGSGAFQARFPVMLSGLLTILVTQKIAQQQNSSSHKNIAGFIILTSVLFMILSHQVMMDIPVLFCLALVFYGLLAMEEDNRWGWLVGLGLAAFFLLKGALGLLLLLALLPFIYWRKLYRMSSLWQGLLLGCLPVGGWYLLMTLEHGQVFWNIHLNQQVFQRITTGLNSQSGGDFFFYLKSMLWSFLPWSFFLPVIFVHGFTLTKQKEPLGVLAFSFFSVFFLSISLMQTQYDHYALPLLLPFALLMDNWVNTGKKGRRLILAGLYSLLGLACLIAAVMIFLRRIPTPELEIPVLVVSLLGLTFLLGGIFLAFKSAQTSVPILIGCIALFYWVASFTLYPWDNDPQFREFLAQLPEGQSLTFVQAEADVPDFCSMANLRFHYPGQLLVKTTNEMQEAGSGIYIGLPDDINPQPRDRVWLETASWRAIYRP